MHLLQGIALTWKPPFLRACFRAIQLLLLAPHAHTHSHISRGFVNIDASYQGNVRCSLELHFFTYCLAGLGYRRQTPEFFYFGLILGFKCS